MKKLIPLLALLCSSAAFAQDQLITLYHEKSPLRHKLLDEYYQNEAVKKVLARYKHQIVALNSEQGKALLKKYQINTDFFFPYAHILDTEQGVLIDQYHVSPQRLLYLLNPMHFKASQKALQGQQLKKLSIREISNICSEYEARRDQAEDTTEVFRKLILAAMGTEAVAADYPLNHPLVVAFLNLNLSSLRCTNWGSSPVRKKASIFKYALEKRDYNFILNVLVKGRCSPNPDTRLKRVWETVDGKQEDLLGFIEVLQNHLVWSEDYSTPVVERIKRLLLRCQEHYNENAPELKSDQ